MVVVHFIENKNIILSQLRKQVPVVGESLTIKGQKGKVVYVTKIDEKNIHVQVDLEKVNKKIIVDDKKKKKK